ncbi:MAG: periplasmic heavy metal sensor [Desulfobacterales bacterium]|jgi:Spy/CpxP family protein refolding chaperone
MNFNKTGKIFMVLAIVAVLAIAATSFAGWGRGGGRGWGGNCWGPGSGYGPRGYGGQGYQSDLSDEDIARLDQERQAFFEATSDLREQRYQKELELRSELAKPEPDAKKASGIQTEISNLESELDQKRLEHRIKMKKDFPRFGYRGDGYGPRGKGMGRGMYRGGGYGPGSCWN